MKKATRFMVEEVATGEGGYVWSYLPDMSRRWGELEAYPSMVWVQPPGTPTMGHLFLDAYHATKDEYYYNAAEKTAAVLIAGQHPSGGWNYFFDLAGEPSTQRWYDTVGKNAWRLEEFQHNWGNATFDDAGTSEAMQFLLRLYAEKRDPKYLPALERARDFVLESQYPIGGWPQRYPLRHDFAKNGKPDYSSFITFNDDVAGENIKFLLMYDRVLNDERVKDAIYRAMNAFLVTQQGAPQPGWALQYTPIDLQPAGARSYEPKALATHTTAANIRQLFDFYQLTGDTKFLARIPEALDWLESVRLPADLVKDGRAYPTFVEIGTNRPLFIHRRGSNVVNGEYYADYDPSDTIGHYSSFRSIDVAGLREEYERLKATPPEEVVKGSALKSEAPAPLPRYFVADMSGGGQEGSREADQIIAALNRQGWWPTPLETTSNPYRGSGALDAQPGDYRRTHVGDATDTSPYAADTPAVGISTSSYIENMAALIAELEKERR
ncbi:pectate lyase [Altericroceibacterium xinjiangense]|uniref:pectate lyase n=1 Tax=Altericroceibacterium xinjiangense TaxID=762261 RepID=UPI000F7E3B1F|nr:pectate lyase [Altericroceibacterium xinjiangense]